MSTTYVLPRHCCVTPRCTPWPLTSVIVSPWQPISSSALRTMVTRSGRMIASTFFIPCLSCETGWLAYVRRRLATAATAATQGRAVRHGALQQFLRDVAVQFAIHDKASIARHAELRLVQADDLRLRSDAHRSDLLVEPEQDEGHTEGPGEADRH